MGAYRFSRYDAQDNDGGRPAAAAAAAIRKPRPATAAACRGDDAESRETVLIPVASCSSCHGWWPSERSTPRVPRAPPVTLDASQEPARRHGSTTPPCGGRTRRLALPVVAVLPLLPLLLVLQLHCMRWRCAVAQSTLNDEDWPAMKEVKETLSFSGRDTWVQNARCLDMTGVTCDASGYVTRLKVPDFSGSLPAAIGDLIHLEYLFCVSDSLTGSLPDAISKLVNLQTLVLPSTGISGNIPKGIGSLVSLVYLNLYGTAIDGSIPSSIGRLYGLQTLNLAYTGLSGSLPEKFGGLSDLATLSLSATGISGSLPASISKLVSLTLLECQKCALSGSLPAAMGSLGNLQYLNLNMNYLSGPLPTAMSGMTLLQTLKLSNNAINGSLPDTIGRLTALTWAELSNNELSGPLPDSIGGLSNVRQLAMDHNLLSGSLPPTISDLVHLRELYLSFNEFFASLPAEISGLSQLQMLIMSNCELDGSLPSQLALLTSLNYLDLSFNSLSGSLPSLLAKLTDLANLDLSHNQLSRSLPNDLLPTNLHRLDLCCNQISGPIPDTIGGLLQLEHLDLSSNRFSGSLPTEMTALIQLTLLNLRSNQLTGAVLQPIPPAMQQYQLDNNYFSSAFPSQPPCPDGAIVTTRSNCAVGKDGSTAAPSFSCPPGGADPQRRPEVCRAFCGLTNESLPCGGHGVCFFDGPSSVPTCACDDGFTNGGVAGSCVPDDGSLPSINTTSDSSPPSSLTLKGSASLLPNASVLLSPAQPSNWGSAFLSRPIRLFSFALLSSSSCGRPLPFSTSFSFAIAAAAPSQGPPSASASAALAFIVSATGAVAGGTSSSSTSVAYLPASERSVSVVFSAATSAIHPNGTVSIRVKSTSSGFTSVATATAPTPLNDGMPQYSWIDYTPSATAAAAAASLRVFLSSKPSPRPPKPVLSAKISLCGLLMPTEIESAFFLGFAAASDNPPVQLMLLQWSIAAGLQSVPFDSAFPLGFTLSDDSLSPSGANPYFRYASAGVLPVHASTGGGGGGSSSSSSSGGGNIGTTNAQEAEEEEPQAWLVSPASSWFRPDLRWPVKQQLASCGDCWAYAVVGAIEAAYSILANLSAAPLLSAPQLRASMRADCQGGSPSHAFSFLLTSSRSGKGVGGLVEEKGAGKGTKAAFGSTQKQGAGKGKGKGAEVGRRLQGVGGRWGGGARRQLAGGAGSGSSSGLCSPVFAALRKLFGITCKGGVPMEARKKAFHISGFERTSFYGWFGLLLAVQRQPVVVHIEASADSFKQYDGLSKYQDPACFTYNLNHVVLLVGYRLVGSDDTAPHMAPPYWIIRNSWGAEWGDGGHMRMDIQGGDGVCGINSLPGLYPIVKSSRDPCNRQARKGPLGPVLNPCGNFTCRVERDSNRCHCNDPRFVEATNADGSRTCAYVDVCRASYRNPCAVGTCVNDGAGTYSCVCPPGFRQGTTVDGTFSCAPGDADSSYTVLSLGLTCAAIHPVYGLTLPQFTAQNPDVSCSAPLPVGTRVNVTPPNGLSPCSVYYTTDQGDMCQSLAAYFQLTHQCTPSSTPCEAALQALNPGLDCDGGEGGGNCSPTRWCVWSAAEGGWERAQGRPSQCAHSTTWCRAVRRASPFATCPTRLSPPLTSSASTRAFAARVSCLRPRRTVLPGLRLAYKAKQATLLAPAHIPTSIW
ncbi:hypothetical protein CLOM_g6167 [Closterium sp. NIES-68]|nr:hypothetical protein CLOM_g6167 [Closterium sp. NIES-68]